MVDDLVQDMVHKFVAKGIRKLVHKVYDDRDVPADHCSFNHSSSMARLETVREFGIWLRTDPDRIIVIGSEDKKLYSVADDIGDECEGVPDSELIRRATDEELYAIKDKIIKFLDRID